MPIEVVAAKSSPWNEKRKIELFGGWITYFSIWFVVMGVASLYYFYHSFPKTNVWAARISPYDEIIHRHSKNHKLDWRLVASIIHTESSFRPRAISTKGALGLMQIMPIVAREQNRQFSDEPDQNIMIGVRHFKKKMKRIDGETGEDALRLSLAAYNVGLGHLRDAQNLAMRLEKNPRRWTDVSKALLLLEKPKYYKKAKFGYCQGKKVVQYVSRVFTQYLVYRNMYPIRPVAITQANLENLKPST